MAVLERLQILLFILVRVIPSAFYKQNTVINGSPVDVTMWILVFKLNYY